jgi:hypothetical protein
MSNEDIKYHKEKQEALLEVSREVGLELDTKKTKYMVYDLSPKCRTKSQFIDG